MRLVLLTLAVFLIAAPSAFAIPCLQLDIAGGTYNWKTETTVATGNKFTLYALLQETSKTSLNDTYYISAALYPNAGLSATQGATAGSFNFAGTTVSATGGMVFGIPPLEKNLTAGFDPGDLAKHDIFETYFKEFSFKFSPNSQVNAYNTQDDSTAPGKLYRMAFDVDLSNLGDGFGIHFDLYSEKSKLGDLDICQFAPFSHDAEGKHTNPVPEPSTLILLGAGLAGFAYLRRKNRL